MSNYFTSEVEWRIDRIYCANKNKYCANKCIKMSRLEPGEEPGPLVQVVVPPDRQLSHNHRQAEPSGHLYLTLCILLDVFARSVPLRFRPVLVVFF